MERKKEIRKEMENKKKGKSEKKKWNKSNMSKNDTNTFTEKARYIEEKWKL